MSPSEPAPDASGAERDVIELRIAPGGGVYTPDLLRASLELLQSQVIVATSLRDDLRMGDGVGMLPFLGQGYDLSVDAVRFGKVDQRYADLIGGPAEAPIEARRRPAWSPSSYVSGSSLSIEKMPISWSRVPGRNLHNSFLTA